MAGGRRPNMEEEADMAGCGERPGGGKRPNMEEEADGRSVEMPPVPAAQGPESSDHNYARYMETPEYSPEKIQLRNKTVFTEAQLNTLEALFKKKPYLSRKQRQLLTDQLSVPPESIQRWFKNRRIRERNKKNRDQEGPESSDDPSAADSKENLEFSPEENQACMRTVFTEEQLTTLEALFEKNRYQTRKERKQLANQLSLPERTIQTWFINQRMRRKTPKKFDPQGPESSDDPSAAHNKENPEYLLEKIQEQKHKRFTKKQLNTLEACFKEEPNPTPTERKKLANQLSVPEEKIKSWYRYQRKKLKHQAPSPKKTPISDHAGYSKAPTEAPQDLQHEQKMDARIKCVQAQKQLHLDSFPPPQPTDSCVLPLGPHSPVRVSCQNVDRPPGSSVTTDLISYDGPSTSSAPSTSKMPITQDNVDEESSTDCSLVIDEDATYSD